MEHREPPVKPSVDSHDTELLQAYTRGRQEADAAFAQLVARHGDMVYQTCLRIVGDATAAEDAAQATFFVLAQKATVVRENVGGYLHGIAVHVARRALDAERLRKAREQTAGQLYAQRLADLAQPGRSAQALWAEVEPHLDADIQALPTQQRQALVLQFLEGRTQEDIARQLGLARGTVAKHVQLGVEKLRHRMARRGIALAESDLDESLARLHSGSACPAFLATAAGNLAGINPISGAAQVALSANVKALGQGVMQMMYWAKVKTVAAVAAGILVIGIAVPAAAATAAVSGILAIGISVPDDANVPVPKPSQSGPPAPADPDAPPAADREVALKDLHPVGGFIFADSILGKRIEPANTCGVFVVRSQQRFDRLALDCAAPGDLRGRAEQSFMALLRPDFTREMVLIFFTSATAADDLKLVELSGNSQALQAKLSLTSVPATKNPRKIHVIAVAVPISKTVKVSYPVHVESRIAKAEGGFREVAQDYQRTWTLDADGGDVIDGLQGVLRLDPNIKDKTIAPGTDLTFTYELRVADPQQKESIYVWDNKYSNGYRNDAYVVVKPDGSTQLLQRPEQPGWDKNIPTVMEIKAGQPWTLGGVANDPIVKSLKDFGLDTTQPGTYTLYGLYQENPGTDPKFPAAGVAVIDLWHGAIATPAVQFIVKAPQAQPQETGAADPGPGNATEQFLGATTDWPKCSLQLHDIHPLFGGTDVLVKGDGSGTARVVKRPADTTYELQLTPEESSALRQLLIAKNFVDLKIPERRGVPDEARPQLILTNAAGKTFTLAKWANDKVPAFDYVYETLLAASKTAMEKSAAKTGR